MSALWENLRTAGRPEWGRKADLHWLDIVCEMRQNSVAQFKAVRQIFP